MSPTVIHGNSRALEDHGVLRTVRIGARPDVDRTAGRLFEPRDDAQRGGLAAAARSHDDNELALRHRQGEVLESQGSSFGLAEGLGEAVDVDLGDAPRRRRRERALGLAVLHHQPAAELRGGGNVVDVSDAVACRVDVLPALLVLVARHDLPRQGRAQHIEIDAGGEQAGRQPVGRGAVDRGSEEDVGRARLEDHLLVRVSGHCLLGGDEARADVAEIGTHGLRSQHVATPIF